MGTPARNSAAGVVATVGDLRRALHWRDAPVVQYPTSNGKIFLDVNGGVFLTLPCAVGEVFERIAESVLCRRRDR